MSSKEEKLDMIANTHSSVSSNLSHRNYHIRNNSNDDSTKIGFDIPIDTDLAKISSIFQSQHHVYNSEVKIGFQHYVIKGSNSQVSPVNALINPGEMCLVMADDSSTTSTFLKSINGEYETSNQFENVILKKHNLIYNDEVDVHFPHLTVDQTIQFAIDCKFNVDTETKKSNQVYVDQHVWFKSLFEHHCW